MTEDFLQYIWKFRLFENENITTTDGIPLKVISTGMQNHDAGPDFGNAKIKIGDTVWVGNIEIHINSSDWNKHKHQTDKAYNNVILHVVFENDMDVFCENGKKILIHKIDFDRKIYEKYTSLKNKKEPIPCADDLHKIDDFYIDVFLERLTIERLTEKTMDIEALLAANKNNIEETFYQVLARNFGFKLNSMPFEMLAKSLPLIYLAKHKNNLQHIEAMLFGQAGLLQQIHTHDDYSKFLLNEYLFFQKKFSLIPIDGFLWKYLRLRPVNFPTIRIAQFAWLIANSSGLFSKIIEAETINQVWELFKIQASEYWDTHYVFGKESKKNIKKFGRSAFDIIAINTIIPFAFVFAKNKSNQTLQDKMLDWLNNLQAEDNSITRIWSQNNIKIDNAFKSQAIIQLNNNYCTHKKCLDCAIGNKILSI